MPLPVESHVIVTSIVGVFHCTDVEHTPDLTRQWFRDSPHPVTDAVYAFGWAAGSALARAKDDYITRDVWLIIGGRVADHAHIRGI
jgi:hypothetical protein